MESEKENETKRWEVLSEHDNMSVLRRQMETGIYEYKGMISNMKYTISAIK
jgi:hypothetical protein